jgi:hypothetical protein
MLLCFTVTVTGCTVQGDVDMSKLDSGLKVSSAEEYGTAFMTNRPQDATAKGFDGYDNRYLELTAFYRKALEQYLLVTLRLDRYENELLESGLGFDPITADRQDYYLKYSHLDFDFIALYNTLYIEHLSPDDLDLLQRLHEEYDGEIANEATELVKRTYTDVIKPHDVNGQSYSDSSYVMVDLSGIVYYPNTLKIAFYNNWYYNDDGSYIETTNAEADDNHNARRSYLFKRLPEIRNDMMAELGVPVTLVVAESIGKTSPIATATYNYLIDDKITDNSGNPVDIDGNIIHS